MVGVPRSQGCRHCRRKKKGCDLEKPSCGQCQRLGLTCTYESKKWTFVQSNTRSVTIRSRSTSRSTSPPAAGGVVVSERSKSPSLPLSLSNASLQRRSSDIGTLTTFWDRFLPAGEEHGVGGVSAGYWSWVVRDLGRFDDAVNICMGACATTALGRYSNNDPSLLREGQRLYSRALLATNQALADPQRVQKDETLACVKLLAMYENIRFDSSPGITTQAHDWHKHIDGTCRIVELRGPEKHIARHGHTLFEEARLLAIISGIVRRKPNFFTAPDWYTIPWTACPRSFRDELFDIMITLPDILHNQDQLSRRLKNLSTHAALYTALTEAQNHLNRCIQIACALENWEQRTLTSCLTNSTRSTTDFTGPLTLLEVCKDYNYGFFHVINIYWAACIILYSSMWIIRRNVLVATTTSQQQNQQPPPLLPQQGPQQPTQPSSDTSIPILMHLPTIPIWANPRISASNIAKTASHYYEEEAGFWGPWTSTFPIGAATQYYSAIGAHDSEEMKALYELFQRPRFGAPAAQFLRSMANSAPTRKGDMADRRQSRAMAGNWYGTDALDRDRG